MGGKTVIPDTTPEANVELLRARGVRTTIRSTPRYQGRSVGANALGAALTAHVGKDRALNNGELSARIDELDLRPSVEDLTP